MMPYSKHSNMELLAECYGCIGDLLKEFRHLDHLLHTKRPKAEALRDEIGHRTKSVTFETGRTHGE